MRSLREIDAALAALATDLPDVSATLRRHHVTRLSLQDADRALAQLERECPAGTVVPRASSDAAQNGPQSVERSPAGSGSIEEQGAAAASADTPAVGTDISAETEESTEPSLMPPPPFIDHSEGLATAVDVTSPAADGPATMLEFDALDRVGQATLLGHTGTTGVAAGAEPEDGQSSSNAERTGRKTRMTLRDVRSSPPPPLASDADDGTPASDTEAVAADGSAAVVVAGPHADGAAQPSRPAQPVDAEISTDGGADASTLASQAGDAAVGALEAGDTAVGALAAGDSRGTAGRSDPGPVSSPVATLPQPSDDDDEDFELLVDEELLEIDEDDLELVE